jgi:hypothetical protein
MSAMRLGHPAWQSIDSIDRLCLKDCLATGGERGFCTQRCTH